MRYFLSTILALCITSSALSQPKATDPPQPAPAVKTGPVLPDAPLPPQPAVGTATTLPAGVWYVIHWSEPCNVVASPEGVLTITSDTGPIKVMGHFSDNPTVNVTKTIADKYVYFVEAKTAGRAELLVIWSATAGVNNITRRTIDSLAPVPDPGPGPGPNPPAPPVPDTTLLAAVQKAYTTDADPAKVVNLGRLAFFYRDAMLSIVPDPTIKTWGQFLTKMTAGRKAVIGDGLSDTRMALGTNHFDKLWTLDATKPFDSSAQALAKSALTTAYNTLENIK